ncbi:uroporphyrinogen-III synthase [Paragonimus westermani]|uniref:Uroporphyrinogen-III synthase n=1 Tax=Paragonimus westermani TaxID=34504 RepID=A0A5J4NGN4_9TREM|nr:uroporphyrinogen-III synthase [Paragonimus westermani]
MYVLLLKSVSEEASGPQDDPYVQILSNAGFRADLIETLDFRYHTSELASYLSWRENHSAIVLTSPRAVTAITKAGIKGKRYIRACTPVGQSSDLCFVVGPSTELQAKKAGFSPKGAQSGDAESLAKYIVSSFGSDIKVNVVIAYSSYEKESMKERVRLNLCEGNPIPDFVVFFSPSGVSLTESILKCELKPHRPKIKLVAMGRATSARLKDLGIEVAAVAASPKPASLLTVIQQLACHP